MRLSIIIPVYNAARYLRECLDSVCGQTYSDFEVVCIDDGSIDGSGEILDEYVKKDSRFRVVHQQNAGVSAARNAGLDAAKGEWITFIDADDTVEPGWLDAAIRLMGDEALDLVRLQAKQSRFDGEEGLFERGAAACWAWTTLSEFGYLWLCFIRRSAIGHLRFRPVINCKEDGIFLMELIPCLRKVCQGAFCGYEYRMIAGSLTKKNRRVEQCVAYLNAYREIWLSQCEWAKTMGVSDLVRKRLRQGADHDVWEWYHLRKQDDKTNPGLIRIAYRELESSGALWTSWDHQKQRLRLPFMLWYATGSWIGFRVLEWMERCVRSLRKR